MSIQDLKDAISNQMSLQGEDVFDENVAAGFSEDRVNKIVDAAIVQCDLAKALEYTQGPKALFAAMGWQGGTFSALRKEITRLKRCEAALCELVALKKLKAEIAEGEPYTMARSVYEQRKALVWPLAFDLVDDVRTAVTLSAVVTRIAYLAGELVMQLSAGEEVPQHLEAGDIVQIQCGPK